MSDNKRPEPGTPEFEEWLLRRAKERSKRIVENGPADFDERGVISGGKEAIEENDKPHIVINNDKKLNKINEELLKWKGASADIVDFSDSMSNSLTIGIHKNDQSAAMKLGAVQYLRGGVYLKNVDLYVTRTKFDEVECFLLRDKNSDLNIVVGAGVRLAPDFFVAISD